jgi:phage tail sheath protein FI
LVIPPSGHISGVYVRTDMQQGVHKAPANATVEGVLSTDQLITKGQQDILNPLGVNCLREFSGRDLRVWGARTTSNDPLWKYINVRRLFLYLEESIQKGTQWVVFEPNNEKLWTKVKQTIIGCNSRAGVLREMRQNNHDPRRHRQRQINRTHWGCTDKTWRIYHIPYRSNARRLNGN